MTRAHPAVSILCSLLLCPDLPAQEPGAATPAVGYVQLINGVTLDTPTHIRLGRLKLMGGKPVPPGGVSGMLGLAAGPHDFEITNESCDPPTLTGTIEIEDGKTFAHIFYTESKTDKEGVTTHRLQYSTQKRQHEHTEPKLSLISLSAEPLITVEVGDRAHLLNTRVAVEIPVELDARITVRQQGRTLDTIAIATPAHYLAFLLDRPDGEGQKLVYIFNKKIIYEPPKERPAP